MRPSPSARGSRPSGPGARDGRAQTGLFETPPTRSDSKAGWLAPASATPGPDSFSPPAGSSRRGVSPTPSMAEPSASAGQGETTMASKQSSLAAKLYQLWLTQPPEDELITNQYGWELLTDEPGGVDYAETDAGGVPAMWAVPKASAEDRVLVCVHGGGFVAGAMYTHRKLYAHLAKGTGARALIVGYRLLPEGVHPIPVDDVLAAYRWLLDQGITADHIAFTGDSAGGGLSITAQLRAREEGLPLPAATMLMCPWVDMEVTGETMVSNGGKDALFNQAWIK